MTLSINVSGVNNAKDCENLSPPGSKRRSDLISPSCNNKQYHRGPPLSDINKTEVPTKAHSTPSKSYATYSSSNNSNSRQQPKWVKNNINTEEIVATDDKQASVGQLSSWLILFLTHFGCCCLLLLLLEWVA